MNIIMKILATTFTFFAFATSVSAQQDADGCKDHPLFTRLPSYFIQSCDKADFDLKRFPKGPLKVDKEGNKSVEVVDIEGPYMFITYTLKDGAAKASPLQIMRNFQAATKKGNGTIEGEYPGWCQAALDPTLKIGNGCMYYGVTMRFQQGNRELWAYAQAQEDANEYVLLVSERKAMKQDIVANELLDKINKDGFVTLYINFDTGKATIKPDSNTLLDQVAAALKAAPTLKIEVGGHTDNVGQAKANQHLSEERAKSVMAALVARGIPAKQLTAKGYGHTSPVADNRTEEGRAKNRRVELIKK
jgi:outer membrane protein OmpA-like peptidoglycan-associated protein